MKIKGLSVVTSSASSWEDVEDLGTLSAGLDKGDKVRFSPKNLKDDEKRVVLLINEAKNPTAAPTMLSLAASVSKAIRKALSKGKSKNALLRALLELQIIRNDSGTFLTATGSQEEGITKETLLKEETISWEELAF